LGDDRVKRTVRWLCCSKKKFLVSRSQGRWMLDLDSRSMLGCGRSCTFFVPTSHCVCRASAGLVRCVSANGTSLVLWEAVWIHLSSAVVIASSLPFRFALPIQIHIKSLHKIDVNDGLQCARNKSFRPGCQGSTKSVLSQLICSCSWEMQLWGCLQDPVCAVGNPCR
jgi:hypothetical protein